MPANFEIESSEGFTLDLFSTSPTSAAQATCAVLKPASRCAYHAPFFAYKKNGARYAVVQGSCHHWDCPRCGVMVAKEHYGRIVSGCREIAKDHDLWFITITCRGADLSVDDATENYLAWTSKFLDACYTSAKRSGKAWYYVQVTEKQKRGHPHSHILTSFSPDDVCEGYVQKWRRDNAGTLVSERIPALRSVWLESQCVRSGLGDQYDISKVESVEAASRYVAKYMFKKSQFSADFPKRWKRVRYSQSFPKLPEVKTDAFVLLSNNDWTDLARKAAIVDAEQGEAFENAKHYLRMSDTIVNERISKNHE